ncbi:MAG TPA: SDR family NAD(P)-dependent oxidoreductase [Candidatus Eisenbacteria bacterium]|jgi:NAD(P)-dependent dehydrogenase (short-subunit alcohol dehydrogenase family)
METATLTGRAGRFAGQSALVLGGSRGLGRAVALALAGEGARVLAVGRNGAALAELRSVARARGLTLSTARADAVRRADVRSVFARAGRMGGGPDLLVHAVGDYWEGPLARLSVSAWESLLRSNLSSAVLALQAALPRMRKRRYGRILFFGVAGADCPRAAPRAHAYRSAKAALLTLARSVAQEEAAHGITVNLILPGVIRTESVTRARAAALLPRVPARRLGTPREVARAAMFLLAPESGYITGTALHISGGWLL